MASARQKRLTLVACIAGTAVVYLDSTVVNVALPAIQRDLGGGLVGQQWVVNAYLITLGSLLLVGGSLGDIYGERRVFAIGVASFGGVSVLCALAPTIGVLIAARALQGVAGALLTPSALAVIVATFQRDERGPAIGSWTAWGGIATLVGPLAGGALLDSASWRWIFLINLPFVAATLALIAVGIARPTAAASRGRVDVAGGLLCAFGLGGTVFALIEQGRLGWGSPAILGSLIGGLLLLAAFVIHERRTPAPMLPLELFRRRNFSVGNAQTLSMYGGLGGFIFLLVLYLQQVAGYSALQAGLCTAPATVMMFLFSRRFGALADRHGPRLYMSAGPLVAAAGVLLLLRAGTQVDYVNDLLPTVLLFGLGLSMTVAPLTAAVLADVDESRAGVASATNNAVARVAGLLGTTVIGALVAAQFVATLDKRTAAPLAPAGHAVVRHVRAHPLTLAPTSGLPARDRAVVTHAQGAAATAGFHLGIGFCAALLAAGGLLAAVGIRDPQRKLAARECPGGALAGAPREAAKVAA